MTPVGFEPAQLALVELESIPLDHSGKVAAMSPLSIDVFYNSAQIEAMV